MEPSQCLNEITAWLPVRQQTIFKRRFRYTNIFTLVCLNMLMTSIPTILLQICDNMLPRRNTFLNGCCVQQSFILMDVSLQMEPGYMEFPPCHAGKHSQFFQKQD